MTDKQLNKLYVALEALLSLHEAQRVVEMIIDNDSEAEEIADYLEKIKECYKNDIDSENI